MRPQKPENNVPRRYEVRHVTRYTYTEDVTTSYGRVASRPRATAHQRVLGDEVAVDPVPAVMTERLDVFGNHTHYIEVRTPHQSLEVAKTAVVEVDRPATDLDSLDAWTVSDAVLDLGAPVPAARELPPTGPEASRTDRAPGEDDPLLLAGWALPSRLAQPTRAVRSWAADLLEPDAPLGTALAGLVTRIHDGFEYRNGATTVWTTQDELLGIGAGVCQDFAHLAIAALRGVGVPARYVSGYLETTPPPGRERLEGSDATHAWLSVLLPDGRWLDLDPTNDCLADGRYVVSGWGRDYRDVAPLKGIIETEGTTSSLTVGVDVIRLD